jgi:hypothetical protein
MKPKIDNYEEIVMNKLIFKNNTSMKVLQAVRLTPVWSTVAESPYLYESCGKGAG